MGDLPAIGRVLVIAGAGLVVIGLLLIVAAKLPGGQHLGRLPGDLLIERGNVKVFIPVATSILLSLVLTALLAIFRR